MWMLHGQLPAMQLCSCELASDEGQAGHFKPFSCLPLDMIISTLFTAFQTKLRLSSHLMKFDPSRHQYSPRENPSSALSLEVIQDHFVSSLSKDKRETQKPLIRNNTTVRWGGQGGKEKELQLGPTPKPPRRRWPVMGICWKGGGIHKSSEQVSNSLDISGESSRIIHRDKPPFEKVLRNDIKRSIPALLRAHQHRCPCLAPLQTWTALSEAPVMPGPRPPPLPPSRLPQTPKNR